MSGNRQTRFYHCMVTVHKDTFIYMQLYSAVPAAQHTSSKCTKGGAFQSQLVFTYTHYQDFCWGTHSQTCFAYMLNIKRSENQKFLLIDEKDFHQTSPAAELLLNHISNHLNTTILQQNSATIALSFNIVCLHNAKLTTLYVYTMSNI